MYEYEEDSEIIGAHCTLLTPYKGYTEGTVVGDFGNKIVVRLSSGKEVVEYRDEVIFTIKYKSDAADSNEIRPMGCARIGKTER